MAAQLQDHARAAGGLPRPRAQAKRPRRGRDDRRRRGPPRLYQGNTRTIPRGRTLSRARTRMDRQVRLRADRGAFALQNRRVPELRRARTRARAPDQRQILEQAPRADSAQDRALRSRRRLRVLPGVGSVFHELLGDEVHAVVQAAHETQIRRPVILVDVVGIVMLDLEQNRLVVLVREFVVDPARERAYARVEVLVLVDSGARRRRDLHEDELADPFGFELEKAFDREESFEYSLGIVEAVHADADHRVRGEAVSLAHVGAAIPQRLLHGLGVERPFYRYREIGRAHV